MRVAVVGSRGFANLDLVRKYIRGLPKDDTIISGGAEGVDTVAVEAAKARGMWTKTIPADWKQYGNKAGAIRNQLLVNEADCVVAFWDKVSKGTKITIDMAYKAKKPTYIFMEDGRELFGYR